MPELDLIAAARHLGGSTADVTSAAALPIDPGVSRVDVRRWHVTFEDGREVRLVIKPCGLTERRTLHALRDLHAVPRTFIPDLTTDDTQDVALLDAGETPLGWDLDAKRRAALAFSEVHARHFGRGDDLAWLPPVDAVYLEDFIVRTCWAGAWTRALDHAEFMRRHAGWVDAVEASASHLTRDVLKFEGWSETRTLAHTDVYHGHVLERDGRALIIDWGQARYASLFLDLGDTFDSPEAAGVYRSALAARGIDLSDEVFEAGRRVARRFAGVRYVWWWLEAWQRDPQGWVDEGLERMLRMAAGVGP
ncbi:hypothetical protein [Deinococcus pimensis]|uniref:hypothetical protein n=1 Tax=Deinococcus pimensis TaxID=309888 RepID=UPI00047FED59|nr:hypothetical protein [Deinococcus pimensis]